jgi:hypothetical protein
LHEYGKLDTFSLPELTICRPHASEYAFSGCEQHNKEREKLGVARGKRPTGRGKEKFEVRRVRKEKKGAH